MDFNFLDVVMAFIVILLALRGFQKGLFGSLFSIVGVVIAFVLASHYHPDVEALGRDLLGWDHLKWVAFALVFVLVYIGVVVAGATLTRIIQLPQSGTADRLLGFGLGIAKGVLAVCLLLIVLTAFLSPQSTVIRESVLAPYGLQISEKLKPMIPADLRRGFAKGYDSLQKSWNQKVDRMRTPKKKEGGS